MFLGSLPRNIGRSPRFLGVRTGFEIALTECFSERLVLVLLLVLVFVLVLMLVFHYVMFWLILSKTLPLEIRLVMGWKRGGKV